MVSHAVWKTWPSGLSYDKNLGLRPRFLSTESLGPCFSHGMGEHDQILQHVATWALTNKLIDTSKWHDNSPLNTFENKSELTLPNDILVQGRRDYRLQLAVIFSSVFAFISHCDVHVMKLREFIGYTWKSRRVTCSLPWTMLQRTHVLMTSHRLVLFYTYTFTFYV